MNPLEQAEPPRGARSEPDPPTPEQAAAILNAAFSEAWWGTFLWLAMTTGARRGELCALRWDRVDLDRAVITIRTSIAQRNTTTWEKDTKTHQQRRIALDADTVALLRAYRAQCEADAAPLGVSLAADARVFSGAIDGSTWRRPSSVGNRYVRMCAKLGWDMHLHQLRHYSATELIASGVDVRTVAGRLGHGGGGSTTLRAYTAWVAEADQRAMRTGIRMPTPPLDNHDSVVPKSQARHEPDKQEPNNPCMKIAADLRGAISCGALSRGDHLPTVNELRQRYAISAGTANRAVSQLREEGLIPLAVDGARECCSGRVDRRSTAGSYPPEGKQTPAHRAKRIAEALDVTIGDLVGEPTLLEWTSDSGVQTVPALRAALMDYRQITPLLANPAIPGEAVDLGSLETDVSGIFDAYQASRYGYVTGRTPLVLSDALTAVRNAEQAERRRALALLALTYQVAVSVLTKLGETDLAWIASERGLAAAQESESPVVLGSLFRSVAYALHSTGRFAAGVDLVRTAAGVLETHLSTRTDESFLSVYGTLFLTGAGAAARADDRASVNAFLREAEDSAHRVGHDANAMWTAFGPTNVALHRMATALELGDVQVAVDLAPSIDVSGLPTERQARHAIETARAYSARNRRDDALAALLQAEQIAPEQIRHHALSRQLVLSWLKENRTHHSTALDGLAIRLRLT